MMRLTKRVPGGSAATASVDASVRRDLQVLVSSVHCELATTMLMVTNDLDEARRIADHCIVLALGRVRAQGHPVSVIGRPRIPTGQSLWFAQMPFIRADTLNILIP